MSSFAVIWVPRTALFTIPATCIIGGIMGLTSWLKMPFGADNVSWLLIGLMMFMVLPVSCIAGVLLSILSFTAPQRRQLLGLITLLLMLLVFLASTWAGKQLDF